LYKNNDSNAVMQNNDLIISSKSNCVMMLRNAIIKINVMTKVMKTTMQKVLKTDGTTIILTLLTMKFLMRLKT
jgi:hypothetical protein